MKRYIKIAHKLTGRNAIGYRARQLGLELGDAHIRQATNHIKTLADDQDLTLDDVDRILYHLADQVSAEKKAVQAATDAGGGHFNLT
jgi:homocitrate synthase